MLGFKGRPGQRRLARSPKNEAAKRASLRSKGLDSPPTQCHYPKPPRGKKSQLASTHLRNPLVRSISCPTSCITAGPKSDAAVSSNSCEGDEADDAEAVDKFALQRIAVFAYFYLCALTLWQGRSIWSLTDDEIQQAIDETFCYLFCPRGQGETDAPADAGARAGAGADGARAQSNGNRSSARAGYNAAPSLNSQRKRALGPDDDDEPNDDGGKRQRIGGNPSAKNEGAGEPLWACPFFCSDPETHRECLQIKMKRIVDVRTHVKRVHTQKPFCVDCALPFAGLKDTERQRHIRARSCLPVDNPGQYFPGATQDMLDMMTLRANEPTAPTQRDKWYVIWDILFPGQEPPPNPYAPVSEVAYAISCYISQYIEQENLQLRRTAREMVRGVTNDLSIATEERAVLERLDQFAQAGEQRRERSGRRNQPSLTTLPTTPSQPSDTPSLVGTMGSSQHTFTNQTGSARTPGHGSDFAVPRPRPPPRPTGFNGAVAQDRPMVPQFPRAGAAVQSVPSTAANPPPNLGPNATEERVNTAYPQALPALWNPTLAPSLALGPDFDFALFFPEDSKNVSNQFGYGPQ